MNILAPVALPLSTLAMVLLLAPVVVMWVVGEIVQKQGREISSSIMSGLRGTSIMAGVLFLCYFCEHHFPFEHAPKETNPMMYWGTFAVLLIGSFFMMRKCSTNDFMPREQTEEWKGWMQFLFLAYHYWKMDSAYSDIRIFITCYLWMTGFGNFSFFYVKQDFSLVRVLQMIFRINFFVFFLCMTMDNHYIVYYICPLHTAYFLVTYATMGIMHHVNHSQVGAAAKVIASAAMLYFIYDGVPQAFHLLFAWLGTTPTGASIGSHGVEWEWYFRTFLDHFSAVWGMVFALNMPFLAEWFKQVEGYAAKQEWTAKLQVLGGLTAALIAWAVFVYSRQKADYNAIHCYYAMVPLLFYLFVRNISSAVRSQYLYPLHWFGAISLESYLLQYHIWLAANAGKLLNIVPGYPILTYIIATCLHIFCAHHVFNATSEIRKVVLPNDLGTCLRNLCCLGWACCICLGTSTVILSMGLPIVFLVMIVGAMSFCASRLLLCSTDEKEKASNSHWWNEPQTTNHMMLYGVLAAIAGVVVVLAPRMVYPLLQPHTNVVLAKTAPVGTSAFFQKAVDAWPGLNLWSDAAASSFVSLNGFGDVGSLAQPWHGLFALVLIALCVIANDPFFGLCRMAMANSGPEGKKSISWEEAYGPMLQRLGLRVYDPEATTGEQAPLRN